MAINSDKILLLRSVNHFSSLEILSPTASLGIQVHVNETVHFTTSYQTGISFGTSLNKPLNTQEIKTDTYLGDLLIFIYSLFFGGGDLKLHFTLVTVTVINHSSKVLALHI